MTAATPLMAALQLAIAEHPTRRVPIQLLRAAHARHDPTGASSSDARTELAAALLALEAADIIRAPRSQSRYESHLQPPLPMWVERPAQVRAPVAPRTPRIWRPELSAAGAMATTPAEFRTLDIIDAFLRDGGQSRPVVPHRERSIELFDDEKKLDALRTTRMFTSGAVPLELLRTYVAPLPLAAQHTGDPGPRPTLLIVENHSTYASALALARDRAAVPGTAALAVGYGSGGQITASVVGAAQLAPQPVDIVYFGDVDTKGISIPITASATAQGADLPRVRPALPLYRQLLAVGKAGESRSGAIGVAQAEQLAAWFDDTDVASQVVALLVAGKRMAQESVGYERLRDLPAWW